MTRTALIATVLLVLGVAIAITWRRMRALDYLRRNGIETDAEVLGTYEDDGSFLEVRARFVPSGADFAIECVDYLNVPYGVAKPAVGSTIRVLYLEADPARARLVQSTW
jgi:hypothetical protein